MTQLRAIAPLLDTLSLIKRERLLFYIRAGVTQKNFTMNDLDAKNWASTDQPAVALCHKAASTPTCQQFYTYSPVVELTFSSPMESRALSHTRTEKWLRIFYTSTIFCYSKGRYSLSEKNLIVA